MSNYDINKLKKSDKFDVESVLGNFADKQQYFDELDKFYKESTGYLLAYNATAIVYNEDIRKSFAEELKKTRAYLQTIGMTAPVETLNYLEKESDKENYKIIADGLTKFYAEIEIIQKTITYSRLSERQNSARPIILAVDDQPALLASVVDMLKEEYSVMAVTSGKAALKVLQKYTPELFLLDIEMPHMSGNELAAEIRKYKQFEDSPIIFLTSRNTRNDVVAAIEHGGNDYLLKPVDREILLQKINRYLNGC